MKKAQILSAIALAFALGVTPVIATVNTASAYTAANADAKPPVEGSATEADVKNAIAAVRANTTYKNMLALKEVIKELDATDSEYGELQGDDYNLSTSIPAVATLEGADELKAYNDFNKQLNADYTAKKITYSQVIGKFVDQAKKADYYNVMAPIFAAYDNGGADYNKDAFVKAILNFNKQFTNTNVNLDINTATFVPATVMTDGVKAVFNDALAKIYKTTDTTPAVDYYTAYESLCNNANAAAEANAKYIAGYNALTSALKADGVLTKQGLIDLAELEAGKNAATKNVTLASLKAIATNTTDSDYTDWMVGATSVYEVLESAEAGVLPLDCEDNYDTIIEIAEAYASVTGNNTQTVQEIAATLVGYKAPAAQTTVSEGPVTVTGAFPADLKLSVVKSDKKIAAFGDAKYAMWDINLIDTNNKVVNYNGSVMVTIEVPKDIDAAKSSVYYVTNEGKVEKLAARVENGKMVFTTSHFSLYAIVEDNGKNFGIGAPDTGIVMNNEAGASSTVAMVAGVATALTAAGAGVVAYRNARRSTRK